MKFARKSRRASRRAQRKKRSRRAKRQQGGQGAPGQGGVLPQGMPSKTVKLTYDIDSAGTITNVKSDTNGVRGSSTAKGVLTVNVEYPPHSNITNITVSKPGSSTEIPFAENKTLFSSTLKVEAVLSGTKTRFLPVRRDAPPPAGLTGNLQPMPIQTGQQIQNTLTISGLPGIPASSAAATGSSASTATGVASAIPSGGWTFPQSWRPTQDFNLAGLIIKPPTPPSTDGDVTIPQGWTPPPGWTAPASWVPKGSAGGNTQTISLLFTPSPPPNNYYS